jgi:hypothetical protein
MEEIVAAPLGAWESFYVIVGSSSAALTGLQFVVIVLSAELNVLGSGTTTSAFATPTIVHFCAVLFISGILSAPWPTLASADIALGACGIAGCAYALTVLRSARRQADYELVLEDWVWHTALPLIAYVALLLAAVFLQRDPVDWLFVIGGIALLLLFVGIHNAWDSVVYIGLQRRRRLEEPGDRQPELPEPEQ